MKITLDSIVSGFKSVTKLITNFDKIEDDLNNKVLYRDNPDGEPNQMLSDLDMNSQRLTNLPPPVGDTDAARLIDITAGITTSDAILPTPSTGLDDQALGVDVAGNQYVLRDGDVLSFDQTATGSVRRTIGDKLRETVTPEDFGAVGDNITDDREAIVNAFNTGKVVVFKKDTTYYVEYFDFGTQSADINIVGNDAILRSGSTPLDESYVQFFSLNFNNISGGFTLTGSSSNISIGATNASTTSSASVSGSAKGRSVVISVASSTPSNLVVGRWISFSPTSGTGYYKWMEGFWEVTDVVPNVSYTIKHTGACENVPTFSVTEASSYVLNCGITKDPLNVGSLITVGAGSLTLTSLAIVGNYDYLADTGSGGTGIGVSEEGSVILEGSPSSSFIGNFKDSGISCSGGYVGITSSSITGCGTSGVLATSSSKLRISSSSIHGADYGIDATNSEVYLSGNVHSGSEAWCVDLDGCYGTVGASNPTAGFIGGGNSGAEKGLRVDGGSISSGNTDINNFFVGARLKGNSYLFLKGGSVTNCGTGVDVTEGSVCDLLNATMSGNSTRLTTDTGGSAVDTDGVYITSGTKGLVVDETASNPTGLVDLASIYVDDTSSDLTVKFGDGSFTTKTLAALSADSLTGDITTAASGAPSGVTLSSGHAYIGPVLIQWGKCESASDTEESFTFSEAFPNEVYSVQLTSVEQSRDPLQLNGEITLTNFGMNRWDETAGTVDFTYIAIGR